MQKQVVIKRISVDLWKRLKSHAALEGRTLHDVIAVAIQQYLDRAA